MLCSYRNKTHKGLHLRNGQVEYIPLTILILLVSYIYYTPSEVGRQGKSPITAEAVLSEARPEPSRRVEGEHRGLRVFSSRTRRPGYPPPVIASPQGTWQSQSEISKSPPSRSQIPTNLGLPSVYCRRAPMAVDYRLEVLLLQQRRNQVIGLVFCRLFIPEELIKPGYLVRVRTAFGCILLKPASLGVTRCF